MNQKTKFILIAVSLAAVIGGSAILYNSLKTEYAPPEMAKAGQQNSQSVADPKKMAAPDFAVFDANGNTIRLVDFKGKPIILNFWASWCPPCRAEMPEFDKISQSLGDDVVLLMVNMTDGSRETKEKAQDYIKKEGFSFPIYFDTKQSAASAYGITALPTTYFIDRNGSIVKSVRGAINAATLEAGIARIR